jgi:hypothetical protein
MHDDFPQFIIGAHPASQLTPWIYNCEALFLVVLGLFVWTAVRRHKMGSAITFDGTVTPEFTTAPERRWTYDHDYMIHFLGILCRRAPDKNPSRWLEFYAGPILELDIAFAVSFATFIVFTSLLIAFYFGATPWLLRVSFVTSGMGIVYGFADVAEDLKLQSILLNAAKIYLKQVYAMPDAPEEPEIELADAAEVDAANALTRIKIVAIALSLVGLVAFAALQVVATLVVLAWSLLSGRIPAKSR